MNIQISKCAPYREKFLVTERDATILLEKVVVSESEFYTYTYVHAHKSLIIMQHDLCFFCTH